MKGERCADHGQGEEQKLGGGYSIPGKGHGVEKGGHLPRCLDGWHHTGDPSQWGVWDQHIIHICWSKRGRSGRLENFLLVCAGEVALFWRAWSRRVLSNTSHSYPWTCVIFFSILEASWGQGPCLLHLFSLSAQLRAQGTVIVGGEVGWDHESLISMPTEFGLRLETLWCLKPGWTEYEFSSWFTNLPTLWVWAMFSSYL